MSTTQIATTAGEVVKACEEAIIWASKRFAAYHAERGEAALKAKETHDKRCAERDAEHEAAMDTWNRLPFWRRWQTPKPTQFAHWRYFGFDDEYLRFKHDIAEVGRVSAMAHHWREATKWLSPETPITMDVRSAHYIGLGVGRNDDEERGGE